jgi:UDP-N-acetylmuramoyl-L-alanyl-D-glutamate--2,6-diaminopimelate ligase
MNLQTLLREVPGIKGDDIPPIPVIGVSADSRQITPGMLFVAIQGRHADGHDYLPQAIAHGAVAALGERPIVGLSIPYWQVPDSRLAWAWVAAAWHSFPARRMVMIGVTGTDGKTTTAHLIHHILNQSGHAAGMITTLAARIGDRDWETGFHVTTPDAMQVQSFLAEMSAQGLTHCVLEATSHGLAQRRVSACEFDMGVMTNITHEHIDYHGSREAYVAAKSLLFIDVAHSRRKAGGPDKTAVLNADDPGANDMRAAAAGARILTYGLRAEADVRARSVRMSGDGLRFTAQSGCLSVEVISPLLGAFNVQNCLAAFAAAVGGLGVAPEAAAQAIGGVSAIPGRMEKVDLGQRFTAIVDFAHTPNALRNALRTARELTRGRVIAVFGAAGLRDEEKRGMMGRISADLADYTVLTAEDPRTESLDAILDQMLRGAAGAGAAEGENIWREPDRGEALRRAVRLADHGDVVIICGKGHEQSMCFGETEYPWDDRQALAAAIGELLGVPAPGMPYLPTSRWRSRRNEIDWA